MQAKSRKQSPGRNMKIDPDLEVGAGDCLRLVIPSFFAARIRFASLRHRVKAAAAG